MKQKNYKDVLRLYKEGRTMTEVAKLVGVSLTTVSVWVRHSGAKRPSPLAAHHDTIKRMARAGHLRQTIADAVGSTPNSIRNYCANHNIKLVNGHKMRLLALKKNAPAVAALNDDEDLIAAVAPEFTVTELAEKWDVEEKVMLSFLNRRGIKFKPRDRGRGKIELTREQILDAITRGNGKLIDASFILGIAQSTLWRKMQDMGIKKPS